MPDYTKSIAEECLEILEKEEIEVTKGGVEGPYRVQEITDNYMPTRTDCGVTSKMDDFEYDRV